MAEPTQPLVERILRALRWAFGWTSLLGGACFFAWGLYGEVMIWVKHSYTIAEVVVEKRRGNKFEPLFDYTYTVRGKLYRRSKAWNERVRVGNRYVVKYAVHAPWGNELYFQYPVPDSVRQDHGPTWQRFMHAILLY